MKAVVLEKGKGRRYAMGDLTAVFKADEDETSCKYSVSEWWMEPWFEGVGAHSHNDNDEIFYVLDGSPEILVGEKWLALDKGAFVRIPANVTHDFRNRSGERAGLFNVFIPGGFERNMPKIVEWFEGQTAGG